jgi:hypothetical protein
MIDDRMLDGPCELSRKEFRRLAKVDAFQFIPLLVVS